MNTPKPSDQVPTLDDVINSVLTQLKEDLSPAEEGYTIATDNLVKLYAIKNSKFENRMSKDAILAVVGNLAGIVMILGYERVHVVTSKALGFVMKTKA